jgi:hypothetical protein
MVTVIDKLVCLRRVVDFLTNKTTVDGKTTTRPWLSLWRNEVYAICGKDVGDPVWKWLVRFGMETMEWDYARTRKILFIPPPYWRLNLLVVKAHFEGKWRDDWDLSRLTATMPVGVALVVKTAASGIWTFISAALKYFIEAGGGGPLEPLNLDRRCVMPVWALVPRWLFRHAASESTARGVTLSDYVVYAVSKFANVEIERTCEFDVELAAADKPVLVIPGRI